VIDGFCGGEIYGKKFDYGRKHANVRKLSGEVNRIGIEVEKIEGGGEILVDTL